MDAVLPAIGSGAVLPVEERRLRSVGDIVLGKGEVLTPVTRNFDINMLTLSNSMERELEDWKNLFAAVDSRFRWKGVVQPEGSNLALLEAVWDP